MSLAERYRAQAAWARDQAEKVESAELREQWLNLARQYDVLARQYDVLAAEVEGKPSTD